MSMNKSVYESPSEAKTVSGGERILVVGPSWVGDMVMAQSLLMVLKQRHPDCVIDVMGPAWSAPIINRMPEARRAITLDVGHGKFALRTRWQLARQLKGKYDRAIVLPRSMKAALVPFLARIPQRVGFTGEQRYVVLNQRYSLDKSVLNQTVKRFVALGLPPGNTAPDIPYPHLRVDEKNQYTLLKRFGLADSVLKDKLVGLMPGAEYGPAKQWPLSHFRQLAESLVAQGYSVIVLGGPKDVAAGDSIAEAGHGIYNLCGETRLEDAVDLLAACVQVVSNDSGLMHVAAAVGTYIQAIYGSSSPRYTPPLTSRSDIHWLALECSPCFERVCPLGHTHCLKEILPQRIEQAIFSVSNDRISAIPTRY